MHGQNHFKFTHFVFNNLFPPEYRAVYELTWKNITQPDRPQMKIYRGADKSLARPTSRCILFDDENISFDASLVLYIYIYIYSTNIPPIMIINRIYEN